MKKCFLSILSLAACLLLGSCGNSSKSVQYLPYQGEKDGKWGMVSTDGEVLFADEFEREPTIVTNDRFLVRDKDNLWEMYTAEEKPKQVGKKYKSIATFTTTVTPAVEPGKCVNLIDKDGNVVKVLDKLEGKTVVGVSGFSEGYAVYRTEDDLVGAIDTKGNVVIQPQYVWLSVSDGCALAVESKYKKYMESATDHEKLVVSVLDLKGNVKCQLPYTKYSSIGQKFEDGVVVATVGKGDNLKAGLLDKEGNWVVKPSSNVKNIVSVTGDNFIFYDGDKCGLMNRKGEVLIRAKYDFLSVLSDDRLCGIEKKGDDFEVKLLDMNGDMQGTETYKYLEAFFNNGDYAPAKLDDHVWAFIGKDGTEKKEPKINIYDMAFGTADDFVESDYVDFSKVLDVLKISKDGVDGLSFSNTASQVQNHIAEITGVQKDAEDFKYETSFTYNKTAVNVSASIGVSFSDYIGQAIKKTEYENYFGFTYSYERTIGYRFANITPDFFTVVFTNDGKMEGKMKSMFDRMKTRISGWGTKVTENKGAYLVKITANTYAFCVWNKNVCRLVVAKGNVNNVDLSGWANPEGDETDSSQYYNGVDADTACVAVDDSDSVAW